MSMKSLGQAEAANRSFGLETAGQAPGVKRHDDLVGLLAHRSRTLVDRPLPEACSVLPECYTDPGFFAFEVDRIFRPGWLCQRPLPPGFRAAAETVRARPGERALAS